MATSFVNIGGDKSDASFRYKMPVMQLKSEGRGNGIKTIILNIKDVSKALVVDPLYPVKFFGFEIGTQTKLVENRCIINGSHSLSTLTQYLESFIKQFVLCDKCGLPELLWKVKSSVKTVCSACGNSTVMKDHKLVNYIIKNPPKNSSNVAIPSVKVVNEEKEEEDYVEWSNDSLPLPYGVSNENEKDTNCKNPVSLSSLISEGQSHSRILSELRLLELSRGLSDIEKYKMLLDTMLDTTQPKTMVKRLDIKLLKEVSKTPSEKLSLFYALEQILGSSQDCISRVPLVFNALYDGDIFDEDFFVCWYDSQPETSVSVSRPVAVMMRNSAERFIEWLKKGDDEDE